MRKDKNGRQTIWLYAIILFTSAFIVLLLTAYSQIKFNKNIDEYRNQLSTESNEKKNFQMNLNDALTENRKLNEELKDIKEQLNKANAQLDENKKKLELEENALNQKVKTYDQLAIAQDEYNKGNIIMSARTLFHNIDANLLEGQSKVRYVALVNKTYKEAAYQLFLKGYKEYEDKRYDQAIGSLSEAYAMAPNEYFSDDSVYFIAYSHYRKNDLTEASKYFNEVINLYPQSNYLKDAQAILKTMK